MECFALYGLLDFCWFSMCVKKDITVNCLSFNCITVKVVEKKERSNGNLEDGRLVLGIGWPPAIPILLHLNVLF